MTKGDLRNLGLATIIVTGSMLGVNQCEQNIQEKTHLLIDVAEEMSVTRDSWKDVYINLGKEKKYLNKYANGCKNPLNGLSKEEMKQYLKLPSIISL